MKMPDMNSHTEDALIKTPVDAVEIFSMAFRTGGILGDSAPQPITRQFPDYKQKTRTDNYKIDRIPDERCSHSQSCFPGEIEIKYIIG